MLIQQVSKQASGTVSHFLWKLIGDGLIQTISHGVSAQLRKYFTHLGEVGPAVLVNFIREVSRA
ncbi:MAG TPA: hypothetical protein DCS33_12490, partial [Gammaproteobacteria bacterium]|nr:hypothetical protein [Gammaproteobacteria bacterium]